MLLLDRHRRLVKTISFGERTYIGDPFNVVRLFNEKEVDELCLLDIDATVDGRAPDLGYLRELASECFMPLTYGGGLISLEQCRRLNRQGIEKFVLGTSATNGTLVTNLGKEFGAQAVVVCIDYQGRGEQAWCVVRSGQENVHLTPLELATKVEDEGAGEILLQSVDRDGVREGMDLPLIQAVANKISVPLIAAGGALGVTHLVEALKAGASAAASGSAFCFLGRLRAVLISYPSRHEIDQLTAPERRAL